MAGSMKNAPLAGHLLWTYSGPGHGRSVSPACLQHLELPLRAAGPHNAYGPPRPSPA